MTLLSALLLTFILTILKIAKAFYFSWKIVVAPLIAYFLMELYLFVVIMYRAIYKEFHS